MNSSADSDGQLGAEETVPEHIRRRYYLALGPLSLVVLAAIGALVLSPAQTSRPTIEVLSFEREAQDQELVFYVTRFQKAFVVYLSQSEEFAVRVVSPQRFDASKNGESRKRVSGKIFRADSGISIEISLKEGAGETRIFTADADPAMVEKADALGQKMAEQVLAALRGEEGKQ